MWAQVSVSGRSNEDLSFYFVLANYAPGVLYLVCGVVWVFACVALTYRGHYHLALALRRQFSSFLRFTITRLDLAMTVILNDY